MSKKLCPECNSEMQFREGVSKKSGKAWAGWFCSDRQCGHVEWDRSSPQRPQNAPQDVLKGLREIYAICDKNNRLLQMINFKINGEDEEN